MRHLIRKHSYKFFHFPVIRPYTFNYLCMFVYKSEIICAHLHKGSIFTVSHKHSDINLNYIEMIYLSSISFAYSSHAYLCTMLLGMVYIIFLCWKEFWTGYLMKNMLSLQIWKHKSPFLTEHILCSSLSFWRSLLSFVLCVYSILYSVHFQKCCHLLP